MNRNTINLFELENAISQNDTKSFLTSFKKLLSTHRNQKETLTENPGLTIYIPPKTRNLDSPKNILIVIHELSRTGAPIVTIDTAKTLAQKGYFITVVTLRRGPLLRELLDSGIPVIVDRELALIHENEELLNLNINFYIDTLFCAFSQIFVITAVYFNLIRRYSRSRKTIIWWLHEGTATYDYFGKFMPQKLGPAIKVYTGGQYAKTQLKKYGLEYDAQILNYGVKDIGIKQVEKKHLITDSDIVKFILPGSIGSRKGQIILLNAIRNLQKKYLQHSEFIFIGDITSEADVEGKNIKEEILRSTQLLPNITYLTSVSREKLFKLYQDIHVLILPSLDDPMPVVATEALMLGKIVLCSDSTGTSYYLKDKKNGFIFKSCDTDELQKKIQYIIDHKKQLSKIGRNGRKIYEQNFTMNVFEKNLLRIVKEAE